MLKTFAHDNRGIFSPSVQDKKLARIMREGLTKITIHKKPHDWLLRTEKDTPSSSLLARSETVISCIISTWTYQSENCHLSELALGFGGEHWMSPIKASLVALSQLWPGLLRHCKRAVRLDRDFSTVGLNSAANGLCVGSLEWSYLFHASKYTE